MRLIKTATLELQDFVDSDVPKYAILSHTWEDGEVLFHDMADPGARKLPGFAKISRLCERALSENLDFAWIDTCCIDKSSSAELSEAINAMYKWYRRASVCYVYLSDISVLAQINDDKAGAEKQLKDCRWFTRGWTLQELLAPQYVKFFDKDWIDIGSRRSLEPHLVSITGIESTFLERPHWASIATRMSWASSRRTTRTEDMAYCLLGLFEVNMPLLYGEGEKAFQRLQHEILRVSDDESLFAWRNDSLVHSGMLALSPADFSDSVDVGPKQIMRRVPTEMTNRGLKIDIGEHLAYSIPEDECDQGMHPEVHLIKLACEFQSSKRPIMILLRAFSSGSRYIRTGTDFYIGGMTQEGIEALGCYMTDKPDMIYVSSTNFFNSEKIEREEAGHIPTIVKLCPVSAGNFSIIKPVGDDGEARLLRTSSSDKATLIIETRLGEPKTLTFYGSRDWILELDLKSVFIPPDTITSPKDMIFCRLRLYKSGQEPKKSSSLAWPEGAALGNGGNFAAELAENEYLWLGLSPGYRPQERLDSGEDNTRCWVFEVIISPFDRAKVLGGRSARLHRPQLLLQSVM